MMTKKGCLSLNFIVKLNKKFTIMNQGKVTVFPLISAPALISAPLFGKNFILPMIFIEKKIIRYIVSLCF